MIAFRDLTSGANAMQERRGGEAVLLLRACDAGPTICKPLSHGNPLRGWLRCPAALRMVFTFCRCFMCSFMIV
jgi:hypothetical protein